MPERMADGAEIVELLATIAGIGHLALTVSEEDVRRLLNTFAFNGAVGPFTDPTAYRDNMGRQRSNKRFAEAFAAFRRAAVERLEAGDA